MADYLEVVKRVRYEVECGGFAHEFRDTRFRHNNRHGVEKDRWCASELQVSLEHFPIGSLGATDMQRDDLEPGSLFLDRSAQGFDKSTIDRVANEQTNNTTFQGLL